MIKPSQDLQSKPSAFHWRSFVAFLALLPCSFLFAEDATPDGRTTKSHHAESKKVPIMGGIRFDCKPVEIEKIKKDMVQYFTELEFPASMIHMHRCDKGNSICYTLNTHRNDTNTMDLTTRPELDILPEILEYKRGDGKIIKDAFTSKKEVLAALMQHGREYVLSGPRCSVEVLRDHVGVRQNIAKWGKISRLRWDFPEAWELKNGKLVLESKYAKMNPAVWGAMKDPLLPKGTAPHTAVEDAFIGSFSYSIGCTTAAKLVMVHGIMDYYRNVKKDKEMADYLNKIAKRAPLSQPDRSNVIPGGYISRQYDVDTNNIIPGDWVYIKNTDKKSSERPGYEGTNTIYIGEGFFTKFYKNAPGSRHGSPYYLNEPREVDLDHKTQEVFNWRFYIHEDYKNNPKRTFLTHQEVEDLRRSPDDRTKPGLFESSRRSYADLILPKNQPKHNIRHGSKSTVFIEH